MSTDRKVDKQKVDNNRIEYYSAIKGNRILECAIIWMSLENILSEISQH